MTPDTPESRGAHLDENDPVARASQVLAAYELAFNAHDAQAMNALFAADASFVNFNGRLVVGKDALRPLQEFVFADGGPLADVRVRYETQHVVALDAGSVILHARQRTESAPTDDPMLAVLSILIMRDSDGRWTIRTGQNTPVTG